VTAFWTATACVPAAGVAFGFVLRRRARAKPASTGKFRDRLIVATVAFALGAPVALIVLAKLFGSEVLGWLFAMSLIADAALVPGVAVFLIGYALGALLERKTCSPGDRYPARPEGPAADAVSAPAATITVAIQRDGVHASDDTDHTRELAVDPGTSLHDLLRQIGRMRFLPAIHGGKSTWIVSALGAPVGIWAEQWNDARLLVVNASVRDHFGGAAAALDFRYRAQADPDTAETGVSP
jgi:hypothetical protein